MVHHWHTEFCSTISADDAVNICNLDTLLYWVYIRKNGIKNKKSLDLLSYDINHDKINWLC